LDEIFEGRLRMLEYADEAGFHAYHVAEHQGTPLSLDQAPSVFMAAATQRTSRLRLIPTVYCLPWHNPFRLYNEICILDQLSKGRIEVGLGRGVSPIEGTYFGVTSADQARDMYNESLQIILAAAQTDKLNFQGKYYNYENLGVWNKPYQKPYPPLWYPTSNIESVPNAAKQGFNTSHNFATNEVAKPHVALYWEEWQKHRNDPDRLNAHVAEPLVSNTRHIYVAESDEKAFEEAKGPFQTWSNHISFLSGRFQDRPEDSLALERRKNNGTALVGSPDTVRAQVKEMIDETGINYFLGVFNFGDLPTEKVLNSMKLFATEVMPAFAEVQAVPTAN
jgi:alkanesulfonate monooxygenase SsuD/methylene tetrahydromethanopterin reductase-like flavin-dependent oxidoreductase (luciferase family)